MIKLTFLISSILFVLSGNFQRQLTLVTASGNSTGLDDFQYDKVLPCFDRTPNCKLWAKSAECRKQKAIVYMEQNCPMTCNLCNSMLQPWTPNDTTNNTVTYESQGHVGILIRVGVDQKLDISDSVMSLYSPGIDTEYIRKRILDIEKGQKLYLDRYYRDIIMRDGEGQVLSSIDMDLPVSHKRLVPYLEGCLNLHPYCFYWASQGYCESKPFSMANVCAPACQVCRWTKHDNMPTILPRSDSWFPSPFKRNDMMGILDAIYNNRVYVDSMGKQMMEMKSLNSLIHVKIVDDETTHILDTAAVNKTIHSGHRPTSHVDVLNSIISGEESTLNQTRVMVLDNFFTIEDSNALLAEIQDSMRNHGFPPPISVIDEDDSVQSNSSNITVILKSNQTPMLHLDSVVERLSMLLNVPLNHIDFVSMVEKFETGGFRNPTSHFKGYDFSQAQNVTNLEFAENPRIIGITIFLSSVKGGEMFFPHMNNLTVDTKAGRIVIFPCVYSLIPLRNVSKVALDENTSSLFDFFLDKSYLIEEPLTFFGYRKVEEGPSYTLTIYFKRRPASKGRKTN